MIIVSRDDMIVTGPNAEQVDEAIVNTGHEFEIKDQPTVKDCWGVWVQRAEECKIMLSHLWSLKSNLSDLGLKENSNSQSIPELISQTFHWHIDRPCHDVKWHYYYSVIRNYNTLRS
jgi:hypothetical protein